MMRLTKIRSKSNIFDCILCKTVNRTYINFDCFSNQLKNLCRRNVRVDEKQILSHRSIAYSHNWSLLPVEVLQSSLPTAINVGKWCLHMRTMIQHVFFFSTKNIDLTVLYSKIYNLDLTFWFEFLLCWQYLNLEIHESVYDHQKMLLPKNIVPKVEFIDSSVTMNSLKLDQDVLVQIESLQYYKLILVHSDLYWLFVVQQMTEIKTNRKIGLK